MTYQQWLADAAQALNQVNPTENGKVDALVLLQHATGKSRTQILAFDETEIDEKVRLKLTALLDRRLKGEPIAYILGEKEFWSLPLNVSEGTCTGAIALALASELSPICQKKHIQLDVIGVDLMPEVVKLAQSNAEKNQLKVQFLPSRWFENVEGQFDIIVSNPPYIDETDEHLLQGDVRFEPRSALVAGENGLADLRHLIEYAPVHLKDNGYLLLEHGWKQGEEVRSIFWQNHWQGVATIRDYGDNERVTLGYWKR